MQVLLITDSGGFGGAEIALCALADALCRKGVAVTIAVPPVEPRFRSVLHRLAHHGVSVKEADGPLASTAGAIIAPLRRAAATRAKRLMTGVKPDAVVVNLQMLWRGAAILDAAMDLPGTPRIAGYAQLGHLPSEMHARFGLVRDLLVPRHLARFDVLLAVSPTQARALAGLTSGGIVETVYQPVDAVRVKEWPPREDARRRLGIRADRLIALPSRVVFLHKGQDVAVRVAAALRRDGIEAHWVVLGDGPDLARLVDLVGRNKLEATFHFLGWRQDLQSLLTAFDVVVLPSMFEGLPLVAVEAAAAGVPVVAYAVDGLIDLLEPPFLVPRGDEKALGRSLREVLRDSRLWPSQAQKRKVTEMCTPEVVADRVLHALAI